MRRWWILAIALLVSVPALAETGTAFERHVERLVATPTPLGPLLLAADSASWRVEVPASAVVVVEAQGDAAAPFLLRASREGAAQDALALPTTHAAFLLSAPGAWVVTVDPLAGVAVDIRVTFRGHVADVGGAPAAFTLTDVDDERRCVVPGVCLA